MYKLIQSFSILFFITSLSLFGKNNQVNILWIFSDDHAYQAIGTYGGRFESLNLTPNLDSIANEGMRFDKCYVANSICAPSRATLLTGKHSHKNGKIENRGEFNHDQMQFQKLLRSNGYQTAMIGKIHLNGSMQGFDYWEVLPGQGKYLNPDFISEKGKTKYQGHSTDIITDRALNWLSNGREKPSHSWLWFTIKLRIVTGCLLNAFANNSQRWNFLNQKHFLMIIRQGESLPINRICRSKQR